jgi:outer membrane protein
MKPYVQAFLCLALWMGGMTFSASAQGRIGIIDLRKVFENYHKTKAAKAAMDQQVADLDKERKNLTAQFQKGREDYNKLLDDANNQMVSPEERDKRRKAVETKLREIQELEQSIAQFDRQAMTTIEEKQRRMTENLLGEIRVVLNAKAKAVGYSMVLDVSGESLSKAPVVVYHAGENDMTDIVLAQLNVSVSPGTAKPNEKK